LQETDNYLYGHNETFAEPAEYILPVIRLPVAAAFGISEEEIWTYSYSQIQTLCDELVCENFEGYPSRYNFTDYEWEMIILANKPVLIDTFDYPSRKLMDTRLMRYPLA
jgi:hypothetical protein